MATAIGIAIIYSVLCPAYLSIGLYCGKISKQANK